MKSLAVLLLVLTLAAAAGATNPVSLGYSDEGTVIGAGPDECSCCYDASNHDGSFENGYAWQYGGVVAPYYGAFGEGIQLADWGGIITCARLWVTTLPGLFYGQSCDIYVWDGGVDSPPGSVLGMATGIVLGSIPNWPTVGENQVNIDCAAHDQLTIGYWGNWPGLGTAYYVGADLDGFGGHPWTYIAPGIGYPTGWNDPSVVWGPTQSLGLGVKWEDWIWSPVETQSWGSIKTLFR